MAKSKKTNNQIVPAEEGSIDPFADGKHIENPEPNNGGGTAETQAPLVNSRPTPAPPTVPNSDQAEQDEVAEGRTEETANT